MAVTGLDHINITTTRLTETRDFFVDVLGLREGARPPFNFPGHWLYAGDGAVVHLMDKGTAGSSSETAALDHIAFAIDDYDGLRDRLDTLGVPYRELGVIVDGLRQMTVHDPNGVKIELTWRRKGAAVG